MLLIQKNTDINKDNISYGSKIKNNIIENSYFYPICYSNNLLSLSSLVFKFSLCDFTLSNCFNKHKIIFKYKDNIEELNKIIKIEEILIDIFMERNEMNIINEINYEYKIKEAIYNNSIKTIIDNPNKINIKKSDLLIKISGIWENNNKFGLNYKFIIIHL
jgi:hypothetical protein